MVHRILVFLLVSQIQTSALAGFDCSIFLDSNQTSNLPVAAKPRSWWGVGKLVWPGNWKILQRRRPSREAELPVPAPPVLKPHEIDRATVLAEIQKPLNRDPDYVTFKVIPALMERIESRTLPDKVTLENDYKFVILRRKLDTETNQSRDEADIPFEVYAAIPSYSPLPILQYSPTSHGKISKPLEAELMQMLFFHPFEVLGLESLRKEEEDLIEAGGSMIPRKDPRPGHYVQGQEVASEKIFEVYSRNAAIQFPWISTRGAEKREGPRFDFMTTEAFRDDIGKKFTHQQFGHSSKLTPGVITSGHHAFWKQKMTFEVIPVFGERDLPELLQIEAIQGSHMFPWWDFQNRDRTRKVEWGGGVQSENGVFLQVTPLSKRDLIEKKPIDQEFLKIRGIVIESLQGITGYSLNESFYRSYPEYGFDIFRFENSSGDFRYFFISHSKGEARTYDGDLAYGPVSLLNLQGRTLELEINPGELLVLRQDFHGSNSVSPYFGNEADLMRHVHNRVQNFEAEGGYEIWKTSGVRSETEGEITRKYNKIFEDTLGTLLAEIQPSHLEVAKTVRVLREATNRLNDLISEFELVSSEKEVIQLMRALHHKSKGQELENLREIIEDLRNFLDYRDHLIRQIIAVYRNLEETLGPRYEDLREAIAEKSDPVLAEAEVGAFENGIGYFLHGNGQVSPLQIHLGAAGHHLARNQKFLSILQRYETGLSARREKLEEDTRIQIWENLIELLAPQEQIE